ncbi:SAM-dependent methyltransferase [Dactylosporangium vinaceum]|uniref:SAM-dependent methyltransferase n=1 Tax=Dactylosporangium vinaceum TaxID=53362 RepID=A0ABV5M2Y0_9ACTN|nr:SAM-dependent methyltransferase [Dactylosporangium vinaceum]UAB96320.1 SAM-dependent methyltransferase [Dactylosporangium vinaceum]
MTATRPISPIGTARERLVGAAVRGDGPVLDERPSPARILDFLRGGAHTFADDRTVGAAILRAAPQLRTALHAEWTFRRHLVLRAIAGGVSEILELGAGMAVPNAVAGVDHRHIPPGVRVVAVDADPVAVEQQRLVHADRPDVTVVHADPGHPETLLDLAGQTLTLREPVLALCLGVLHHLPDTAASRLLAVLSSRLPAGSRLVISHLVTDDQPAATAASLTRLYAGTSQPLYLRTRRQFRTLLHTAGLTGITPPRRRRTRGGGRGMLALAAPHIPGRLASGVAEGRPA